MGSSESCLAMEQNFNLVPNLKGFFSLYFFLPHRIWNLPFDTVLITSHPQSHDGETSLQKCYSLSASWLALPTLPSSFSKCPHHKVQFFPDYTCTWLCESFCLLSTTSVCGKALGSFMKLFPFCFLWVSPWVGKSQLTCQQEEGLHTKDDLGLADSVYKVSFCSH